MVANELVQTPAKDIPSPTDFTEYVASLPETPYLQDHRVRYIETWARIEGYLSGAGDIMEMGSFSPISDYLRIYQERNVQALEKDLRLP